MTRTWSAASPQAADDCLSLEAAARVLGVSTSTLHRWLNAPERVGLTRCPTRGHIGVIRVAVFAYVERELRERGVDELVRTRDVDVGVPPLASERLSPELQRINAENTMLRQVLRSLKMAHVTLADALDAIAPPVFPDD